MPENSSKISLPWTEEHTAFCYQHHICPAAKSLWQWLMMQGAIAEELEPDLSEFNATVAKARGKGYSHNYLKQIFEQLVEHRVIQVVKQYSWKIFKLLVRPLEWLKPPRRKREKNLQNHNLSYSLDPSNDKSIAPGDIQQQHSNSDINLETLAENGIHFDSKEKEVLDRPTNEIKLALIMFNLRGALDKILNPEGWIRTCLRKRIWEQPTNYRTLLEMFGNSTEWDELFPSG
ncbi:hypothetical protein CDG77_13990 [Nostoc sp. 'Peltigera membranacea cyanobiont' 213]|uniref:hypothetical protein n=1 Tax=Nostoc sp. 'Peltigera membranacea cyanobiont' 213 TaxID=2014530 RepID=UPI000B95C80F|nr:hypothetical protein [Nostoc sp. 'Peltigera membranacea cyanobiont' 213]OYD92760.1 hypothetical protein CDG77_13990 [Nostoc sp. 'Peltigera membranacea cyanobiont' 213]